MKKKSKSVKSKKSSINTQFEILAHALGAKYTTTFNNCIANASSINEAVFISWFIYMWEHKAKNGEMFLVAETFHRRSSIPIHAFRKIVKKWEQIGIVETRLKGVPMKKYYRLKKQQFVRYLTTLLNRAQVNPQGTGGLTCQNQQVNPQGTGGLTLKELEGYINSNSLISEDSNESSSSEDSNESSSKKHSCGLPSQRHRSGLNSSIPPNGTTIFDDPNLPLKTKRSFADRMSKKLWTKVASKNQLPCNSKDRSRWTAQFTQMMREDNGRTKERVKRVLSWYIKHYGEDRIPEARCANTFRKKFCEIESAMNRWLNANGQQPKESDSPTIIKHCISREVVD